jgi:hypothetical protein
MCHVACDQYYWFDLHLARLRSNRTCSSNGALLQGLGHAPRKERLCRNGTIIREASAVVGLQARKAQECANGLLVSLLSLRLSHVWRVAV